MAERDTRVEKERESSKETGAYLRFLAMIATAMVVMYITTYLNTYELSHVEFSETRVFMTLIMGSTMALVMLGFMLGMYKDRRANLAIVLGALAVLGLATWLVRSQTTVQEESYMRAMIPHHSIAILTSENSEIEDRRVCALAVEIVEAQRREIDEMKWLIEDIADNGPATSAEEAARRQVPEFVGTALRTCG
jgi:hypothetical protein